MCSLGVGSKELAERTSKARIAAGLSLSEAAKLLGFKNYQTLSEIEKGKRKLNANELSAMAHYYKRSLDYFFNNEIEADLKPLWRKSSNYKVESVQMQFQSFLENYTKLENLLELTRRWKDIIRNFEKSDFLTQGFDLSSQIGVDTWSFLDLGSRPACNLLSVLENNLRFKILHLRLPTEDGISSACVVDDKLGVGILINASDAPWRRNFDIAHELFHIITWNVFTHEEVGDGGVKTLPEKYADVFASSLLLPEKHIKKYVDEITTEKRIRIIDIIEMAKDFGVSTEAILWRLVNLNIIHKKSVQEILQDESFKESDKQLRKNLDSNDQISKFPSRYISLACRALMEGKMSRGTFAEYMEIERYEVDDFLKEGGFMEQSYEKIASA